MLGHFEKRFAAPQHHASPGFGEIDRDLRAGAQLGDRAIGKRLERRQQDDGRDRRWRARVARRAQGLPAKAGTDQQNERGKAERGSTPLASLPRVACEFAQYGFGRPGANGRSKVFHAKSSPATAVRCRRSASSHVA